MRGHRTGAIEDTAGTRLSRRLHRARDIQDIIRVLRSLARHLETERVMDALSACFLEHGVEEAFIIRMSRMHRQFGRDDGICGYAICTVWSVLLSAIGHGAVIYVP